MTRSQFGSITRKGSDRYLVRWDCGTDADGRRVQKSHVVRGSRDAAELFLARKRLDGDGPSDATWQTIWDVVVDPTLGDLAEKTVHEYRRLWTRELAPRIGNKVADLTTWKDAERTLAQVESPTVQRAALRLWRKVSNMAEAENLIQRSPITRNIRLKPYRKPRKALYAPRDVVPWVEGVATTKYAPALLMELGGGLRHEEACAMVWERVSCESIGGGEFAVVSVVMALPTVNRVRILKETKTEASDRDVVIGEPFASALLALHGGSGPVCPSTTYRPHDGDYVAEDFANPNAVTLNYRRWCEREGIAYVAPGSLRTVFSTLHAEAMSPDSLVSMAMGHTDGTTRGRNYLQSTRKGGAAIARNLAALIESEK